MLKVLAQQHRIAWIVLATAVGEGFAISGQCGRIDRVNDDVVVLEQRGDQRAFGRFDRDGKLALRMIRSPQFDRASIAWASCSSRRPALGCRRFQMKGVGLICPVDTDKDGCLS